MKTLKYLGLVAPLLLLAACGQMGAPEVVQDEDIQPLSDISSASTVGSTTSAVAVEGCVNGGASTPFSVSFTITGNQATKVSFKVNKSYVFNGTAWVGDNPETVTVDPRGPKDANTVKTVSGITLSNGANQQNASTTPFPSLFVTPYGLETISGEGATLDLKADGTGRAKVFYNFTACTPTPPANTAPSISVPSNFSVEATGPLTSVDFSVTAGDEEDGIISNRVVCKIGSNAVTSPVNLNVGAHTVSCNVTDSGGLSPVGGPRSFTITVTDPSAPDVNYTLNPAPADGSNGWYKSNVSLTWSVTDGESTITSTTGCADQNITADQVATSYSCSATSAGGTTGPVSVSIKRDSTAPVISGSDVNNTTWRNTPLSQLFTASDATSGLAGEQGLDAGGNFTLTASAQSANASTPTTVSKTVTDNAGNSSTRTLSALIDTTAPVVNVTGVINGATYTLGSVPTVGCSTTDALSGVATHAALGTNGGPVGSVMATCSGAADNAGNAGSASVTYNVTYDFKGFFRPVDMGNVLNRVKAGSAVPVKFTLDGNQGLSIFAAGYPKSVQIKCPSDPADPISSDELATGSTSGLSYDGTQYNYVWKTGSWAGTCRQLQVKFIDGQEYTANFQFVK